MSGWFEISIKGGNSAFIDAGLVRGVARHPKLQAWDASTPDYPLVVFLGDNREAEIFGPSAIEFMVMCERVRKAAKESDNVTIVPRDSYQVGVAKAPHGFDIQIRYAVEP